MENKVQQMRKHRLKGLNGLGTSQGVRVVAGNNGLGMGTDCKGWSILS